MTKISRVARNRKIRPHLDAAGAVGLGAEPQPGGRGDDAGRPDDRRGRDALAADRDAVRVAGGHRRVRAHFDAEPLQRLARGLREAADRKA